MTVEPGWVPPGIDTSKANIARVYDYWLGGDHNFQADLREPGKILADPETQLLLDFSQPTGLLLVAILHFIPDDEDPWRIVGTLREALAPGSYLVLCHGTDEGSPKLAHAIQQVYNRSVDTALRLRSRAEILRFFDGFELVDPGLVPVPEWRPESPPPAGFWGSYAGVGKKP